MNNNNRLCTLIGLCRKSASLIIGTEAVITSVKRGKSFLVLSAGDCSDRTLKQLTDKCSFHNVPLVVTELDKDRLGQATGKSSLVSAVAVTNLSLAKQIISLCK